MKPLKVTWTKPANRSAEAILEIIGLEQPYTAQVLLKAMVHFTTRLAEFPRLGKKIKKKSQPNAEYREYILSPLRIMYLIEEKEITILQVLRTEEVTRLALMVAEQAATYSLSSAATATGLNQPSLL